MEQPRTFHVRGPDRDNRQVEAWSTYPIQFGGQRTYGWVNDMVGELGSALGALRLRQGEVLSGIHMSTEVGARTSDVQNRLFLNPGEALPKILSGIRFEAGVGAPPTPGLPLLPTKGHLFYYRYRPNGDWEWWEPDQTLASWQRVPRELPDDGTARPYWFAVKRAAVAGRVHQRAGPVDPTVPLGLRITLHGTPRGPRRASATLTENVMDGALAAFHGPPADPTRAAAALSAKLRRADLQPELRACLSPQMPAALFATPAIRINGAFVQISPCDERCLAGEVVIRDHDSHGTMPEISGEMFTLRPRSTSAVR